MKGLISEVAWNWNRKSASKYTLVVLINVRFAFCQRDNKLNSFQYIAGGGGLKFEGLIIGCTCLVTSTWAYNRGGGLIQAVIYGSLMKEQECFLYLNNSSESIKSFAPCAHCPRLYCISPLI